MVTNRILTNHIASVGWSNVLNWYHVWYRCYGACVSVWCHLRHQQTQCLRPHFVMLRRAAHMSLLEPLDRTEDPDHKPTVHFIVLVMGVPMVIRACPWPSSVGTGSDSGACQAILACTTMLCFLSELYNVYQWVNRRDPMVLFLHSSPFRLKLIFREDSIFLDGGLTASADMEICPSIGGVPYEAFVQL